MTWGEVMTITAVVSKVIPASRFRLCGLFGLFLLLSLTSLLFVQSSPAANGADLSEKRLDLLQKRYYDRREKFAQAMLTLAGECDAKQYFTDAERIRTRALPVSSGAYDLDLLPEEIISSPSLSLPVAEREWRAKLQKLERDYAVDLYRIAREALRLGHPTMTYRLVRETAFHDPNNVNARSMLGYVQEKDRWTTPFLKRMAQKGMVDHPRFGWIETRLVSRYEAGERFFNGQWMSAEKEAALRADFQNGWEIGTEHFLIRTNVGLEQGVELSRQLEEFQRFFMREYVAFFNSRQQIEKLLDVGARPQWKEQARYQVSFYRTKEEFVAALKPRMPGIENANGLYIPRDRMSYFYSTDNLDAGDAEERLETMYHEVTHQILGESRPDPFDVGELSDFWVIEGFPCYLESFDPQHPGGAVGDPRHIRIFWARKKIIEESQHWPMREFAAMGRPVFPLQAESYNQGAAMVHFFLNAEQGQYRDGFIHYLSQVYLPSKSRKPTLEDILGVTFETLDRQFIDYLKTLPSDPPPGVTIELVPAQAP